MTMNIFRHSFLHPALLPFTLLALLLQSCASNPTGGMDFVMMSESAELEKGKELHEEILNNMPIYQDPDLNAYVNEIGQKLVDGSHRSDIEYTFTIIDSPDINAFALPGGYVYVNRGLMAYLTSEAQLAAVIGHEIGHITGRHAVRQDAARKTNNVLAGILAVGTGVGDLGEASAMLGGTVISGYGRDMELEADGLGAEYLYNAGYDPNAMVEVITVLKNQEDFNKRVSGESTSYHGLFATHPRNDTRLIQAVGAVGDLDEVQRAEVDPAVFRQEMEGLPIGQTMATAASQDRNRYYQNLLSYTMIFPENWDYEETTTTVTSRSPDEDASLSVTARLRSRNIDPRVYVNEELGISNLQQTEAFTQYGLPGYTGIIGDSGERLAVIYLGNRAFIFRARGSDEEVRESIHSFRPIARQEVAAANPVSIDWIRADGRTTYADLARGSRLGQYAEDQLRLMNGDYPSGEPDAGEWIKIAR